MPTLDELREAMRSATQGVQAPPGLVPAVQGRMRRRLRLQVAGAAALVAAVIAAVFVPGSGGGPSPDPVKPLATSSIAPPPAPPAGMRLLKVERFETLNKLMRVEYTPTGRDTVFAFSCPAGVKYYIFNNGGLDACGYKSRLRTGVGQTYVGEFAAAPDIPRGSGTVTQVRDAHLAANPPVPGSWTVAIYSGTCDKTFCPEHQAVAEPPQQDTGGLPTIASVKGSADARRKPVDTGGAATRMRLTCLDGAAWAVIWQDGVPGTPISCEAAESRGTTFDVPGGARIEITVFPASVSDPLWTDDPADDKPTVSSLAKLAKGVKPIGKWTLTVYRP
jgi:hypothetical protein